MPFARKFRAMMDFPFPGDAIGDFTVERVDVCDEWGHPEGYVYAVAMVLRGPGGQQGVKRALASFFAQHPTTFSGYGNPYQLWFRKPEIESLGDRRYAVTVKGAGVRIFLDQELERLLAYLEHEGHLQGEDRGALLAAYLEAYRAEIKRMVDRYRRRFDRAVDASGAETLTGD